MSKVEELDDLGPLTKPSMSSMTNDEWQRYFSYLLNNTTQSRFDKMKETYELYASGCPDLTYFVCNEESEWDYYCAFINDILNSIRGGEQDYCYHIYQIVDLLRFEHDRLQAIWSPENQCFVVSLK